MSTYIKFSSLPKVLKVLVLNLMMAMFVFAQSGLTLAITPEQKNIFDSGILKFDAETCETGSSVSGASEGGPLKGVHFPAVADKAVLAKAIDEYIKKGWPSSPLKGYGEKFVLYGEKYDVNPLIAVVIAQVEYQFGTARTDLVGPGGPGQYNYWAVTHNSNASTRFGAYPSIDAAMEEHFKLLGGKHASAKNGISYIGPPQSFTTIKQIMNQYAPAFENDTANYIKTIISGMGKILREGGVTPDNDASGALTETGTGEGCACTENIPSGASLNNQMLENLAKENGGQTTIAVLSVDGKLKAEADGDKQMPTRSTYKVYTAYATLKAIEEGKITWNTKIWGGNSVEKTMEEMIVKSNNDAAEALRTDNRIGTHTQVTRLLQQDVGLSNKTVMGSGNASDAAGSNSKSTANDFVKFLSKLEQRKLPGVTQGELYDKLLSFMKHATTDGGSARAGIVAGVEGTVVADKAGWASGSVDPASNDVGIVYLENNPYTIAILTDKPNQWDGVAKIAKAVHGAVGGSSSSDSCAGAAPGDFAGTIKSYAWPDYHNAPFLERKPAYAAAVRKAASERRYTGGSVNGVPGIDCGAFVTLTMVDSGFEPNYNTSGKGGNTLYQQVWLMENWQKINPSSTKDLQPGDVAINDSHTFMHVGKIDGFNDVFASASYSRTGNGRAPMAGQGDAMTGAYNWYRKK